MFEPFEGLFNGEEEWLARLGKNEKEGKKDWEKEKEKNSTYEQRTERAEGRANRGRTRG